MIPFAVDPFSWFACFVFVVLAICVFSVNTALPKGFSLLVGLVLIGAGVIVGSVMYLGYIQHENITVCNHVYSVNDKGTLVLVDGGSIYTVYDPLAEMLIVDGKTVEADIKYYPYIKPIITHIYGNVTCGVARCT